MAKKKKDTGLLGSHISGGRGKTGRSESRVLASDRSVPDVERLIESDDELSKAKAEDQDIGAYFEKCIRHAWRAVEDGRMLLTYAAVGYDYATGYPIYDYDILVDLLMNYGYAVDVAVMFAGEFARSYWPDGVKRVVSHSPQRVDIYTQVEKLPDNPCI